MIKATTIQRKQIDMFFRLITEDFDKILLHPVVDKDDVERLSISVVEGNNVYLLGVLFLEEDPLADQFNFKEEKSPILKETPKKSLWKRIKRMFARDKGTLIRKE